MTIETAMNINTRARADKALRANDVATMTGDDALMLITLHTALDRVMNTEAIEAEARETLRAAGLPC
jgi:hypothetical protein